MTRHAHAVHVLRTVRQLGADTGSGRPPLVAVLLLLQLATAPDRYHRSSELHRVLKIPKSAIAANMGYHLKTGLLAREPYEGKRCEWQWKILPAGIEVVSRILSPSPAKAISA